MAHPETKPSGLRRTSLGAFIASAALGGVGLPCWLLAFMAGMNPHASGSSGLFQFGLWCLLAALLGAAASVLTGVAAMVGHRQPCPWIAAYAMAFILPAIGFVLWGLWYH